MGSFITGTEVEVIRDEENWEPFETVTIREYSQGAKDALDKELIEMAGVVGEIPRVVMQSARVPVVCAGTLSWTLRNLSDGDIVELYVRQAERLEKDVGALSFEDKCEAVKDVVIVPLTREWINKLKPSYAGFIVRAIRKLNQGRTSAEERDFLREVGAEHLIEEGAASGDNGD